MKTKKNTEGFGSQPFSDPMHSIRFAAIKRFNHTTVHAIEIK